MFSRMIIFPVDEIRATVVRTGVMHVWQQDTLENIKNEDKFHCSDGMLQLELMGFWTLFVILVFQTEHIILETGSVPVLRWKDEEVPPQLGLSDQGNLNHWSSPHEQSPKTQ
jgi:hypothetical protein